MIWYVKLKIQLSGFKKFKFIFLREKFIKTKDIQKDLLPIQKIIIKEDKAPRMSKAFLEIWELFQELPTLTYLKGMRTRYLIFSKIIHASFT